jgi:hypothetical protein
MLQVLAKVARTLTVAISAWICFDSEVLAQVTAKSKVTATLDGLEVTQGIQNPANSVPLVAGRPTWVRAFLTFSTPQRVSVVGEFRVVGADKVERTRRSGPVTVKGSLQRPARMRRDTYESGLNIAVPRESTDSGSAVIELVRVLDASSGEEISCVDCRKARRDFKFQPVTVLRLKVVGFRYRMGDDVREPQGEDFDLLEDWLRRAYPVSSVVMERVVMNAPAMSGAPELTCGMVNRRLAHVRALDIKAGQDPRVHYYGMVLDDGARPRWFMAGCSSAITDDADPSVVASGPAGVPDWRVPIFKWDDDRSYADWYGGHEIAHTFGRRHPGACPKQARDDPEFPYADGLIGDASVDNQGFDARPDGLQVLSRSTWADIMSYCMNPWPSAYTYQRILTRLQREEDVFQRGGFGRTVSVPDRPNPNPAAVDTLIHLLVDFTNVSADSGKINWSFTVAERGRSPAIDSSMVKAVGAAGSDRLVRIEMTGPRGELLYRGRSWIQVDQVEKFTDGQRVSPYDGAIPSGTVSAYLPNLPDATSIRVWRGSALIDTLRIDFAAPALRPGYLVKRAGTVLSESGGRPLRRRFEWQASDSGGSDRPLTYFIQMTDDGRRWTTIEDTEEESIILDLSNLGARTSARIRILASDGKNDAELYRSCDLVRPEPGCT